MESKKRNFNVKICTLYHMNIITVQTLCDLAFKLVTAARTCILLTKEKVYHPFESFNEKIYEI